MKREGEKEEEVNLLTAPRAGVDLTSGVRVAAVARNSRSGSSIVLYLSSTCCVRVFFIGGGRYRWYNTSSSVISKGFLVRFLAPCTLYLLVIKYCRG